MNVSKQHREDLLKKIQQIRNFIASARQDQNTGNLLQYLDELTKDVKGKKYGLVFEQHREQIDETLETHTPVLTEQKDLFIDNGGEMNFLIEGDNLAALKLLEKTHKGKIDVIYIDPPYNTGKEDFVYDDAYIDANDNFKHSKWLSFIKSRLLLAKNILSKNGIIFISIDDHEQSNLKLLCDDDGLFGEDSFINNFMWLHGKGKKNKQSRTLQQYVIAYGNANRDNLPEWTSIREARGTFSNPDNDPRGDWFSGSISFSEERSNKNHANYYTIESPSGIKWTRQWMCTQEEMCEYLKEKKIYFGTAPNYNNTPRIKIYPTDTNEIIPDNILPNVGTTRSAQKELNKIIGMKINDKGKSIPKFDNPKPHELIEHLSTICSSVNDFTILDFFAGSGTTGHAVMKLNAEDGGHRKFILCTNNENNICRDVTYERLKTVITGKRKDGSEYSEKYDASLKYYKIDFVKIDDKMYYEYADELLLHIRELVELENGVNFNGNAEIAIVLTDDEMEKFVNMSDNKAKILYRGHDVLMTDAQETFLREKGIKVNVIPDYYYNELNR